MYYISSCKEKDTYQWKGQNKEDIMTSFEQNYQMYQEIADIFISNNVFWEKARQYDDDIVAWIMSPNDEEKISYFSKKDQIIIKEFFRETSPYEISINDRALFSIHYINKTKNGGFTLSYYYGDKTKKNYTGYTEYDLWITGQKSFYSDFKELGNNWFFYR